MKIIDSYHALPLTEQKAQKRLSLFLTNDKNKNSLHATLLDVLIKKHFASELLGALAEISDKKEIDPLTVTSSVANGLLARLKSSAQPLTQASIMKELETVLEKAAARDHAHKMVEQMESDDFLAQRVILKQ